MVSKIFVLDGDSQNNCTRILLILLVLSGLIIAITLCVYTFKSNSVSWPVCPPPEIDSNTLSNWTMNSEYITYACMKGYTLEGNETFVSHCENNATREWFPAPPKCIHDPYLPILLECPIEKSGFEGNVTIWQTASVNPVFVKGYLNTTNVKKTDNVFSEKFPLSYSTCTVKHQHFALPTIHYCQDNSDDCLNIAFNSTALIPYKQMDLKVTLVFLDAYKTAAIVALQQDSTTLIMELPIVLTVTTTTTPKPNSSTTEEVEVTTVAPTNATTPEVTSKFHYHYE